MNREPGPSDGLSPRLKEFLQRWVITTVAVIIAEWTVPGIHCGSWRALLIATLILGALNMVLRPLIVLASMGLMAVFNVVIGMKLAILTLPLQLLLFGFLLLAINAVLLMGVANIVPSFSVAGFWAAFWGGVVISLITVFLNSLTGSGRARITVRRGGGPGAGSGHGSGPGARSSSAARRDGDDGPSGPIIDV